MIKSCKDKSSENIYTNNGITCSASWSNLIWLLRLRNYSMRAQILEHSKVLVCRISRRDDLKVGL